MFAKGFKMSEKFNPTVEQIRECRALILDYINSTYGVGNGSISESLIFDVMLQLDEPICQENVSRDLEYMRGRGLIEKEFIDHPIKKTKTKRWKLTARGVTFIEHGKPWKEIEQL